jgi:type VI protein secretion system component VasF
MDMALVDLCEPLFQYVCSLNRLAREGGNVSQGQVEAELETMLADIKSKAKNNSGTSAAWDEKVEWALIAFCDFTVRESKLPYAGRWRGLGPKRGNLVLDEQFFDLLNEALRETGESAIQRLAVFYTILGLGFTGMHAGQPDKISTEIRAKMRELYARIGGNVSGDGSQRICPQAYEKVDQRTLELSTGSWLVPLAIVFCVLSLSLLAVNVVVYRTNRAILGEQVNAINEHHAKLIEADKKAN